MNCINYLSLSILLIPGLALAGQNSSLLEQKEGERQSQEFQHQIAIVPANRNRMRSASGRTARLRWMPKKMTDPPNNGAEFYIERARATLWLKLAYCAV